MDKAEFIANHVVSQAHTTILSKSAPILNETIFDNILTFGLKKFIEQKYFSRLVDQEGVDRNAAFNHEKVDIIQSVILSGESNSMPLDYVTQLVANLNKASSTDSFNKQALAIPVRSPVILDAGAHGRFNNVYNKATERMELLFLIK